MSPGLLVATVLTAVAAFSVPLIYLAVRMSRGNKAWESAISDLINMKDCLFKFAADDPSLVISPAISRLERYAKNLSGYRKEQVESVIFKLAQYSAQNSLNKQSRAELAIMIGHELVFNFIKH